MSTTEPSGDDPIPRYAQLDVWMALYGSHRSAEYEPYREKHGFALTWANLCAEVRRHALAESSDVEWSGVEYGWAPHAHSLDKFDTQEEAKSAYYMAVGHPVRHWKRRILKNNGWERA